MSMEKSVTIHLPYSNSQLYSVLSDPEFVLPRLFPPIKEVEVTGDSFNAYGRFMGMRFHIYGILNKGEQITYKIYLTAGTGKGEGKLVIRVADSQVELRFEYEGWMERFSGILFMDRWFDQFVKRLKEEGVTTGGK